MSAREDEFMELNDVFNDILAGNYEDIEGITIGPEGIKPSDR